MKALNDPVNREEGSYLIKELPPFQFYDANLDKTHDSKLKRHVSKKIFNDKHTPQEEQEEDKEEEREEDGTE